MKAKTFRESRGYGVDVNYTALTVDRLMEAYAQHKLDEADKVSISEVQRTIYENKIRKLAFENQLLREEIESQEI